MKKPRVRCLQCTECEWKTWGFTKDTKHFDEILEEGKTHVRKTHNKRSSARYLDMPFMPDDYPLWEARDKQTKRTD